MSSRPPPIAQQVIEQASEWFITLRDPSVSVVDRTQFADWLRASPLHTCAYLQVAGLWLDAAQLRGDLPTDLPATELIAFPTPAGAESVRERIRVRRPLLRTRLLVAAAALFAFLAAGGLGWHLWVSTYSTGVGEQRALTLEDGSIVRLNSRSRIRVHFSPSRREIDLLDGQALFQVAKDAGRPFVVDSGSVAVRAVGTQFDVYRKVAGTVVTVVEGRVAVAMIGWPTFGAHPVPPSTSARPDSALRSARRTDAPVAPATDAVVSDNEWLVLAGEQLTVASSGAVEPRQRANLSVATSWLRDEWVFEGRPLSEVVDEFNRYSRRPLIVADPTLAQWRVSGVFHSTDPESLIRFFRRVQGIEVAESGSEIRISRRPSP